MSDILYYPYINVPDNDWTIRTLLYYKDIAAIVPQEYLWQPERNYDPFMMELVRMSLIVPINPIEIFDEPWEVTKPFVTEIEKNKNSLEKAQNRFYNSQRNLVHSQKFSSARIHADKFDDNVFYSLENLGLASRAEGNWYAVETKTADQLMKFVATIIGAKTNRIPMTDNLRSRFYSIKNLKNQKKRQTILESLIPFPQNIKLDKMLRFKEKHGDLLDAFTSRVELLVLDPTVIEGTDLFNEKIRELVIRKGELTAKMGESQIGKIILISVFGIIGATQGIVATGDLKSMLWGLPGFANAVYSAMKIEKTENVFDQSGMKYLALVDKKLR